MSKGWRRLGLTRSSPLFLLFPGSRTGADEGKGHMAMVACGVFKHSSHERFGTDVGLGLHKREVEGKKTAGRRMGTYENE